MAGAELFTDIAVIFRALVGVFDQQTNRRTRGLALEYAREDFDLILLPSLRGVAGSPRFAPVQVTLKIRLAEFQPRWAAIDDTAYCGTVAFAKSGDGEEFAY